MGYGFLEEVYETALVQELRRNGLDAKPRIPLTVFYKGVVVGEYFADLLVEGRVVIELKTRKQLVKENVAQLLNYLQAGEQKVGLLINFSPTGAQIKRYVVCVMVVQCVSV